MFTINDMMDMVKAGKTNEEIKELYAIGKEITENAGAGDPAGLGDPGAGVQPKEPDDPKPKETDPAQDDADQGTDQDPDGENIDWKKEYEELKAKYQQKNVRENMQGQFDDQKSSIEKGLDILSEMIR